MSFAEMTNDEWEAVRRHHDALVHMAELELKAEKIRATCPRGNQAQLLKPIEVQMRELDDVIAHLPA